MLFFKKELSEKNLVGVWKHPLIGTRGNIEIVSSEGTKQNHSFINYHFEIFNFKSDKTFTFGEYTSSGPLYEVQGRWRLSSDKKNIELSYDNGETSLFDIRKFDGKSFVTTSIQGNDFLYTKE